MTIDELISNYNTNECMVCFKNMDFVKKVNFLPGNHGIEYQNYLVIMGIFQNGWYKMDGGVFDGNCFVRYDNKTIHTQRRTSFINNDVKEENTNMNLIDYNLIEDKYMSIFLDTMKDHITIHPIEHYPTF